MLSDNIKLVPVLVSAIFPGGTVKSVEVFLCPYCLRAFPHEAAYADSPCYKALQPHESHLSYGDRVRLFFPVYEGEKRLELTVYGWGMVRYMIAPQPVDYTANVHWQSLHLPYRPEGVVAEFGLFDKKAHQLSYEIEADDAGIVSQLEKIGASCYVKPMILPQFEIDRLDAARIERAELTPRLGIRLPEEQQEQSTRS